MCMAKRWEDDMGRIEKQYDTVTSVKFTCLELRCTHRDFMPEVRR